jgi:carbamoyl-phosphate synthase large subunit
MRSTGEVLGIADSAGMAFFKAQSATQVPLPQQGKVLITVADADKPSALEPARLFRELGFGIYATDGTRSFLAAQGIEAEPIRKLGYGRPDIVDAMKNREIQLVINTPSGKKSQEDDSYIRKTAIRYKIPNMTTTAAALAAAKGIAARRQGKGNVKSLQAYHSDIAAMRGKR